MTTEYDSNGKAPQYYPGDRVYVHPLKVHATVIKQTLSWDYPESFWGNVELQYDDGIRGTSHCWQIEKVKCTCHTCLPMTMDPNTVFMRLCPTCGNKRCPKATNHTNTCTNSNDPGQEGSIYYIREWI